MKSSKIKFVQLEPGAFLTDPDFIKMTPFQRGIYCSLILALYSNGGSLKLDKNIGKLCGCSYSQFFKNFSKISFKFREKNGKIFHKKVSKVLAAQKKFLQAAYISGLKGGRPKKGTPNQTKRNENETKSKKERNNYSNSKRISNNSNSQKENDSNDSQNSNSNSPKILSLSSNSLRNSSNDDVILSETKNLPCDSQMLRQGLSMTKNRSSNSLRENSQVIAKLNIKKILFIDSLNKILYAKTRSDRTCFNRVCDFLCDEILKGKFTLEIFDRVLGYAKEAHSGENPNALFMSLMRNQLGYERKPR